MKRPTPSAVSGARCAVHAAAAEWGPFDVVRLAHLIKLGRPSAVVYDVPATTTTERGDAPGCTAIRPESTATSETRALVLAAWRLVATLAGWPLPSPHALKDADENGGEA